MSNVAKLKKKAADFELKKDFAKALAVYVEILDNFDQYAAELDVSLFNRVGDLMLRQGNVADAVDYYERAVVRARPLRIQAPITLGASREPVALPDG